MFVCFFIFGWTILFNGAQKRACLSDTAAVIIIKSGESCSAGSFNATLLWHCVYQIKTTCPWILFWTHLHGKQVYECNELLLAPLQLLMEAKSLYFCKPKTYPKTYMGKPIFTQTVSVSRGVIRKVCVQQIWHLECFHIILSTDARYVFVLGGV